MAFVMDELLRDKGVIEAGVWKSVEKTEDFKGIRLRVTHVDSEFFELERERYAKRNKDRVKSLEQDGIHVEKEENRTEEQDRIVLRANKERNRDWCGVVANHLVFDWEGITDTNGNAVPYDAKFLATLFSENEDLLVEVQSWCSSSLNFTKKNAPKQEVATQEDVNQTVKQFPNG